MIAEDFVDLFGAERTGRREWTRKCPAHADHGTSLRITNGHKGAVQLTCAAGCEIEDIVDALGLDWEPYSSWPSRPNIAEMSPTEHAAHKEKERARQLAHGEACQRLFQARKKERRLSEQIASLPKNKVTTQMRVDSFNAGRSVNYCEKRRVRLICKMFQSERFLPIPMLGVSPQDKRAAADSTLRGTPRVTSNTAQSISS
jgi:hypothetical protein